MAYGSSASDRLTAVRDAINRVLSAQEYGTGLRRTRYADLNALRNLEKELEAEVARESGGMVSLAYLESVT